MLRGPGAQLSSYDEDVGFLYQGVAQVSVAVNRGVRVTENMAVSPRQFVLGISKATLGHGM
jgi:hypothetical protein